MCVRPEAKKGGSCGSDGERDKGKRERVARRNERKEERKKKETSGHTSQEMSAALRRPCDRFD